MWTPVAVVNDIELAGAMADVVREYDPGNDVSVVSADELLHTFRAQDREWILGRLNSRTNADIQRELTLRRTAGARLTKQERRSGLDRRSGRDRRSVHGRTPPGGERRSGRDRRSGRERRAKIF
jgi:hypothetical protein